MVVILSHTAVGLGSAGQICAYIVQWPVALLFWLSKLENMVELTMISSFLHAKKSKGCKEVDEVHMSFWEQENTARWAHSVAANKLILPFNVFCHKLLPSSGNQMTCSIKCFRPAIPFRFLFSSSRQVLIPAQTWLSPSLCLSLQCYLSPQFQTP